MERKKDRQKETETETETKIPTLATAVWVEKQTDGEKQIHRK